MTPQEKLTETFNIHAGKVVEARIMDALLEKGLRERLTNTEMDEFLALSHVGGDPFDDKTRNADLKQKIGDGSYGVYSGNNGIYFDVRFLEFSMDLINVPPAILSKFAEAIDEAVNMAPDFREQVKNGTLKPLKLKF